LASEKFLSPDRLILELAVKVINSVIVKYIEDKMQFCCSHCGVACTSLGIEMKLWYWRALTVHGSYGRTRGPAVCNSQGFQLFTADFNVKFWEVLVEIWDKLPSLIGPDINDVLEIEVFYNVFWSFCCRLDY
jgi:hypothetical protein